MIMDLAMRSSAWLSCGLLASALVGAQQPAQYAVTLVERSPLPTVSAANARGHGHCPVRPADKAPCQCFNPSYIPASAHKLNQSGVLLRICCGYKSCDYLCRREDKAIPPSACAAPPAPPSADSGPNFPRDDEYIGFAPCDITTGKCGDVLPRSTFSLDPSQGTIQDPRAFAYLPPLKIQFSREQTDNSSFISLPTVRLITHQHSYLLVRDRYDGSYYSWYHTDQGTERGSLDTVGLSRSDSPLTQGSWQVVRREPWVRNACCLMRPRGERSYCIWGMDNPDKQPKGLIPGLGISWTTDIDHGNFTQAAWKVAPGVFSPLASQPSLANSTFLMMGPEYHELGLEAGARPVPLSDGNWLHFYASHSCGFGWNPTHYNSDCHGPAGNYTGKKGIACSHSLFSFKFCCATS